MTVWHHQLLLVFAVSQFPWRVIHSLMIAMLCVNAANNSKSTCNTHTNLPQVLLYPRRHLSYMTSCMSQVHACMHACGCVYRLLLAVGCLHNQHSSTPWSQGKLSTVLRENRTPFHTWVVREWPTFTDGTDGRLFYSSQLVYSTKYGFQLLIHDRQTGCAFFSKFCFLLRFL